MVTQRRLHIFELRTILRCTPNRENVLLSDREASIAEEFGTDDPVNLRGYHYLFPWAILHAEPAASCMSRTLTYDNLLLVIVPWAAHISE